MKNMVQGRRGSKQLYQMLLIGKVKEWLRTDNWILANTQILDRSWYDEGKSLIRVNLREYIVVFRISYQTYFQQ